MVTYGGNRPTVSDDDVLTAQDFNDATRFWVTDELPDTGKDGDVVFVIGNDPVGGGELPGLGGWATITEVSGTYTKHTYDDWVAFEWTADGELTTSGGLVESLIVGPGGSANHHAASTPNPAGANAGGAGGGVFLSIIQVEKSNTVQRQGTHSSVNQIRVKQNPYSATEAYSGAPGAAGDASGKNGGPGFTLNMIGTEIEYGFGNNQGDIPGKPTVPNSGQGAYVSLPASSPNQGVPGEAGVVIVRVPKEYAQNVIENFFRWISYATVENGVVTKVTKTPDNQPYTASAQEVECDDSVQEGYLYENGEFTAPEPDYSDEIEALTARLEELRNG